ncbi:MAG: ComEC/Rec2 family competence protein [Candidatus Omnitrophica bacterium]|nr:ComEC/Rec2 family competence protein [Candidatus Omnitrophota bacterium]
MFFVLSLFFEAPLLFVFFFLGAVSFENSKTVPKCHIMRQASFSQKKPYLVKGVVASEPFIKDNHEIFFFTAQVLENGRIKKNVCGDILVKIKSAGGFHYADELVLTGHLKPYFSYPPKSGYSLMMRLESPFFALRSSENKGRLLKRSALRQKASLRQVFRRYLSESAASILGAMVLGERKGVSPLVYEHMKKTGTAHLLVISGFHVGVMAFACILALKLAGIRREPRIFIVIFFLFFYCLLTGASVSTVRATIMAVFLMLGDFLKRRPDIYNSLALAAFTILWACPGHFFNIGFQLSFASVFSIVFIYPKIKTFLRIERCKIKILRFLSEGLAVSLSAWLGTMGLIAYYFKLFSFVAVAANLFIVPLAALITLSGITLLFTGSFLPPLAYSIAPACEFLVRLLVEGCAFFYRLPLAYIRLS